MVVDSLKFPTRGEDGMMRAIIGGGLFLVSGLIPFIPQLLIYGYSLQAMRAGARGNPNPPEFDDWESLLKDGAYVYGVSLLYTLIPTMLLMGSFVGLFVFSIGASSAGEGAAAGMGLGLVIVLILGGLGLFLLLVASYLIPAALVGVATEEEFMAAFEFKSIREIAFTSEYFVAVIVAWAVGFIGALVAIPLVFLLVGFPLFFLLQAGIFHYFGTVARNIATV